MRRALTKGLGAAILALALLVPRLGWAAGARTTVRVVLVANGESPPWFDGFVKHLRSELGLRGIDVEVARALPEGSGKGGSGEGAAPSATTDAELVVAAPSLLRPVLRFAVTSRDEAVNGENNLTGRVREVNLAGVPSDGYALALAVAADELMRSNWPRAVPAETARQEAEETPASASAAPPPAAPAAGRAAPKPTVPGELALAGPNAGLDGDERTGRGMGTVVARESRFLLGAAAAVEAFTGGQAEVGPDLRLVAVVLPRLDLELRGGWRSILSRETTNGVIGGQAMVAGVALRGVVLGGARASLSFVGRADLLRAAYSGEARDATVAATSGNAFGCVLSAGPSGRIALSRGLAVEGDLLAGASPVATTATDAGNAVVSTNGAAFMASLGLFLGL